MPIAALIASWNCCSLISRRNLASAFVVAATAARVSFNPCASAGTAAVGLIMLNAAIALATASSIGFPADPTAASTVVPSPANTLASLARLAALAPPTRL